MKALLFATTAALIAALSTSAFAETDGTTAQNPQTVTGAPATVAPSGSRVVAAKGEDPDQIICKSIATTGSHLGGSRVCRTRAVWEDMARAAREDTSRIQNSDTGTNIPH